MGRRTGDAFVPPDRHATQRFLDKTGQASRWTFDVDLGELCEGHHVVGTEYDDSNSGAFGERGGEASHGTRDIGGVIPASATRLTLDSSRLPDGRLHTTACIRSPSTS